MKQYEERMYHALKELESGVNSIHMLRNRLLASFEEKFPEYKDRYRDDDIGFVYNVENLLLTLHNKIDTIAQFYEMVIILEKTVKMLNTLKEDMNEMIPTLDLALYDISNSLLELRAILKIDNSYNTLDDIPELPKIDDRPSNNTRMLFDQVNIY